MHDDDVYRSRKQRREITAKRLYLAAAVLLVIQLIIYALAFSGVIAI